MSDWPLLEYLEMSKDQGSLKQLGANRFRLHSQTWQGFPWSHDLSLNPGNDDSNCAILIIEGGPINDTDEGNAKWLADRSGLTVVTLYDVPNQPYFGDLWEDDLVAETFARHLETGDPFWPLLLPMVASVFSAIRSVSLFTNHYISRYVCSGMSKRGWTAWLAACTSDPSIAGIAPMSFDHLKMFQQLEHQLATWGAYSDMYIPYERLDISRLTDSKEGARLHTIIDPANHLERVRCPVLSLLGSNDPFWQVDAYRIYADALPNSSFMQVTPNAGHTLGSKLEALASIAAFAHSIAHEQPFPFGNVVGTTSWASYSESYDFRTSVWLPNEPGQLSGYRASFEQTQYEWQGGHYTLATPMLVERLSQP